MRETTIKVRLTVDEREAAELRAAELGYENFSQFVRAALRGSATSSAMPMPAEDTRWQGIEAAQRERERDPLCQCGVAGVLVCPVHDARARGGPPTITEAACPRGTRHQPGVRCGYCGATP